MLVVYQLPPAVSFWTQALLSLSWALWPWKKNAWKKKKNLWIRMLLVVNLIVRVTIYNSLLSILGYFGGEMGAGSNYAWTAGINYDHPRWTKMLGYLRVPCCTEFSGGESPKSSKTSWFLFSSQAMERMPPFSSPPPKPNGSCIQTSPPMFLHSSFSISGWPRPHSFIVLGMS